MSFPKVRTPKLVLIAGIVWMIAGINILRLGIESYVDGSWPVLVLVGMIVGTALVFAMYHRQVFNGMVQKHVARIMGYESELSNVFRFFDAKSYMITAVMMGGGIALRMSGLVPGWFIAFFYTGIGIALTIAGACFLGRHFLANSTKMHRLPCPFTPSTWPSR